MFGEKWHIPPSFNALAFHNGREHHNMNARINIADDPSMSDKNLVNYVSVTPEFCRHVCTKRATRWLCHTFLVLLAITITFTQVSFK